MPNGYTVQIADGTPITFRDFILGCARGFGFAILQRDDPADAPLITHYEPRTDFYDEMIATAREEIDRLLTITTEEAEREAQDEYQSARTRWEESVAENAARAARYDAMTGQVQRWRVPAELMEMKRTILKWLTESKEWDCHSFDAPQAKTGPEWLQAQREKAERNLAYGLKERSEEIQRTNERNRHLSLLLESLGDIPSDSQATAS